MDKKETGEYEEEKGTGSEAKKMGKERMGENEEICLFENVWVYPMTLDHKPFARLVLSLPKTFIFQHIFPFFFSFREEESLPIAYFSLYFLD